MDYEAIGQWLLKCRESLDLSQKDVASRMGRHALTVRRMERGEPMKLNTLMEYVEILGESPFTAILVGIPRDGALVSLRKTLDHLPPGERGLLLGKSGELASRLLAMEAERGFQLEGEQLYERLRLLFTETVGVLDAVERITTVFSNIDGRNRLLSEVSDHLNAVDAGRVVDGYGDDGLAGLDVEVPVHSPVLAAAELASSYSSSPGPDTRVQLPAPSPVQHPPADSSGEASEN